jgi:hypothetical protein
VTRDDLPAVVQAITSSYSSGVNEGRITDVKLQKRLMAGRAKVPLLGQRVVLIAHLRRCAAAARWRSRATKIRPDPLWRRAAYATEYTAAVDIHKLSGGLRPAPAPAHPIHRLHRATFVEPQWRPDLPMILRMLT